LALLENFFGFTEIFWLYPKFFLGLAEIFWGFAQTFLQRLALKESMLRIFWRCCAAQACHAGIFWPCFFSASRFPRKNLLRFSKPLASALSATNIDA
jgi:hypothetical protein